MTIEITPQAIDQASNRVRGVWGHTRIKGFNGNEDEGIYSWLQRITFEAIENGERLPSGKYRYAGIKLGVMPFARFNSEEMVHLAGHILQSVERCK
jgi:hypothetical protein